MKEKDFNTKIAAISILVENLKTNVDEIVSMCKCDEAETCADVLDKLDVVSELLGTLYRD